MIVNYITKLADMYNVSMDDIILDIDYYVSKGKRDNIIPRNKGITRSTLIKYDIGDLSLHEMSTSDYLVKPYTITKQSHDTPEYRKKLSDGVKRALSDPTTRKKWSDVKKGKLNNNWSGYLIATDLDENIVVYETVNIAAMHLSTTRQTLIKLAKNGATFQRGPMKGWKFELSKEYPTI